MEKKKIEKKNQFWENAGKFFAGVFVVFLLFRPYIKKVIREEFREFNHKSVTFSKEERENRDSSKIKIIPLKTLLEQKNKKLSNTKKEVKTYTKPQTQKNKKKNITEKIAINHPCSLCHESGRCSICGGLGTTYNVAGTFPCSWCMGNGMCQNCKGLGYYTTYHYSDGMTITSNGTIYSRDGVTNIYNTGSSSTHSSGSTSISEHKCSTCGGTGLVDFDTNPPNFTGEDDTYEVLCRTCGKYYPKHRGHTHITCKSCRGNGYIEY